MSDVSKRVVRARAHAHICCLMYQPHAAVWYTLPTTTSRPPLKARSRLQYKQYTFSILTELLQNSPFLVYVLYLIVIDETLENVKTS